MSAVICCMAGTWAIGLPSNPPHPAELCRLWSSPQPPSGRGHFHATLSTGRMIDAFADGAAVTWPLIDRWAGRRIMPSRVARAPAASVYEWSAGTASACVRECGCYAVNYACRTTRASSRATDSVRISARPTKRYPKKQTSHPPRIVLKCFRLVSVRRLVVVYWTSRSSVISPRPKYKHYVSTCGFARKILTGALTGWIGDWRLSPRTGLSLPKHGYFSGKYDCTWRIS